MCHVIYITCTWKEKKKSPSMPADLPLCLVLKRATVFNKWPRWSPDVWVAHMNPVAWAGVLGAASLVSSTVSHITRRGESCTTSYAKRYSSASPRGVSSALFKNILISGQRKWKCYILNSVFVNNSDIFINFFIYFHRFTPFLHRFLDVLWDNSVL